VNEVWRAFGAVLLCGVLCAEPVGAEPQRAAGVEISVLSYNVHGISWLFAKDNPQERAAAIGWLASRYDVVLLQEAFEYHDEIGGQMAGTVALRGNGMRGDPRLLLTKLMLFPFQIILPDFSFPYGSGLSAFVAESAGEIVGEDRHRFDKCSGWFERSFDCWATKGALRLRVRLDNGAEVDFYNTHLDAGQTHSGIEVRARQLNHLVRWIERESVGRAVVVTGDFNTALSRMENVEAMRSFKQRTRLADVGAGPELPQWPRRDFIFVRDGEHVALNVVESGEALEFVSRTRALSDHPAAYARLEVSLR
jgi:endonuclease/exonuclease/phosphatase family metal-dependent hydrolase